MGGGARRGGRRWHAGRTFERFTDRARRVLVLAQEEARLLDHPYIGTEHILLGLIHQEGGIAARALRSSGISLEAVREKVEETVGPPPGHGTPPTMSPPFTPRAKKVLELSLREALQMGHNYIGTEHMLLGIIREGEGVAVHVLISLHADLGGVRQTVISLLKDSPGGTGLAPSEPELRLGSVVRAGVRWRLEVVQAGRTPEAYEAASGQLTELVNRLEGRETGELDPSAVTVRSVDTADGPGLQLVVSGPVPERPAAATSSENTFEADPPTDEGGPGEPGVSPDGGTDQS